MKELKKKITALALIGSIAVSTVISGINVSLAQDFNSEIPTNHPQIQKIEAEAMKKEARNLVKNGKIAEITKQEDFSSITVISKEGEIIFHISNSALIFDEGSNKQIELDELKKDDEVAVIWDKKTPMSASLPPQISQVKALIVKVDAENLLISMPDENLRVANDEFGEFIMIKNDKMNVFHVQEPGKTLTQDALKGAEAIILYKVINFSLPPQVHVDAAIVLNTSEELIREEMEEEKEMNAPGVQAKYVPLRKYAEEKGYQVIWQGIDQPIILKKYDIVVEISLNTKMFKYSHMTRDLQPLDQVKELDLMPILENSLTMVSENFIQMLK